MKSSFTIAPHSSPCHCPAKKRTRTGASTAEPRHSERRKPLLISKWFSSAAPAAAEKTLCRSRP